MKKFLSCILAALMLSSAACMAVNAEVIYTDDFENGKNEEFWGAIGKFAVIDGTMNGYSDARIAQALYKQDSVQTDKFVPFEEDPTSKCYNEFTLWVDVKIAEDAVENNFGAGFWVTDTYDLCAGYYDERTIYNLLYYAKSGNAEEGEEIKTAFARLYSDNPAKDDRYPDHIYGELSLPEAYNEETGNGFNVGGDAVKLGLRYGKGNITGYANGKLVASYNYETIGIHCTPLLFKNDGCYAEFDNFGLGTYDENVKAHTRTEKYTLAPGKVTVSNDGKVYDYTEDDEVKVTAPAAPAGKVFDKWEMTVGDMAVENTPADPEVAGSITGVDKAELLHGIAIGDLAASELTFTMPNSDVTLTAVYKDAVPHNITVTGGKADPTSATVGTTVTITADKAPEGKSFDKWVVKTEGVTVAEVNKATTTFVMPDAEVELEATYKDGTSVTSGDVNGDGKINARDISSVMKHILGNTPADFISEAADMTGEGKINARDISAIMKVILG